jgi:hypothetical protein
MDTKTVLAILAALTFVGPATAQHTLKPDGSGKIACGVSTMLFGGAKPPTGFMVQIATGGGMAINDDGPANPGTNSSPQDGFLVPNIGGAGAMFTTPTGYTPLGPVSVYALCQHGTLVG